MRRTLLAMLLVFAAPAYATYEIAEVDPLVPHAVNGFYMFSKDARLVHVRAQDYAQEKRAGRIVLYDQTYVVDTVSGKLVKTIKIPKDSDKFGLRYYFGKESVENGHQYVLGNDGKLMYGVFPADGYSQPAVVDPEKGAIRMLGAKRPFGGPMTSNDVALSKDNQYFAASARYAGGTFVYDTKTGKQLGKVPNFGLVRFVGNQLWVLGPVNQAGDYAIVRHQLPSLAKIDSWSPEGEAITGEQSFSVSPDHKQVLIRVATSKPIGSLFRLYDTADLGQFKELMPDENYTDFESADYSAWSPDSRYFAALSSKGMLTVIDAQAGTFAGKYDLQINDNGSDNGFMALKWASNQEVVAMGARGSLNSTRPVIIRIKRPWE